MDVPTDEHMVKCKKVGELGGVQQAAKRGAAIG